MILDTSRFHRRSSARLIAAAGLLFAVLAGPGIPAWAAVPGAASSPSAIPASASLPVLGSTTITEARKDTGSRATVLVNGIRRIPGATVLYFSVGLSTGAEETLWTSLNRLPKDLRYSVTGGSQLGSAVLVDMAGKRLYSVLVDDKKRALASPTKAWPTIAGKFFTLYEVLPELPAGLDRVDVLIGNADVVQDVPVENGVLEPAVTTTGPLPLGQGWPTIDQTAAAGSFEPKKSISVLTTQTSDIEKTIVRRETPDSISVDLSADVLFASGSAQLGAAASAKVRAAADQINSRSGGGRITVIGHTDDVGSNAHNDVLSRDRAAAVLKVLKPLVTVAGVNFATEGRGERDPVSSNDTAEGRQDNRRVSVVFAPKAGAR